ncbi:MAG: hypothetical protein WCD18_23785 [Thermosynechococcaceae cyanobacterium]
MSKDIRNRHNPGQMTQNLFLDPWVDPETKIAPQARWVPLECKLLKSDPSLAHKVIVPAGSPSAKALGGGHGAAILHPLKVLLKDELKIKTAFRTAFGEHTRNAVALMMWFHSPTFG